MNFLYPLLVVLLAVFAVAPLEYPGAFQSQTGLLAVYNLINLDQNPLQFFNWAPTLGREYDLFRMDGALPYWVAEIFHRVGFGYLDSIKLVYALAWLAGGLTMFVLARKFFNDAGALLAATVYTYLPFHIATVYVRGAFAESVAWAIFPLALLGLIRQQTTDNRRQKSAIGYLLSAGLFAALFLTQLGMAILFSVVALAIAAALRLVSLTPRTAQDVHERDFVRLLATVLGGGLISVLLYASTIFRYGVALSRDVFTPDFVLPFQLFSSAWSSPSTATGSPSTVQISQGTILVDPLPFQLGVVPVGLAIIAVAVGWQKGVQPNALLRRVVTVFLAAALGLTLLTFGISAPLWNVLGVLASPWQLLAFVGLALAIAAGAPLAFDARLSHPAMLAVLVSLPIVASYGYLTPHFFDVAPTRPPIAIFGRNEIALLDYRIVGPLRHGATVRLELRWQALRPVDHDYTVFVHAVHADGMTWGQEDAKPVDGTLPTIKWTRGQVVLDTHTIQIDVEGPREGYHLEMGLYQSANSQRAFTDNGADQLILPRPGDPEPIISDQLPPQSN